MAKLTEAEKAKRKHQRSADRKNAKAREQAGPLFADQVEQTTAAAEYWHWRRNVAKAGQAVSEHVGADLLNAIGEAAIRRFAHQALGQAFERLDAYRWHTFPADHGYGFWRDVLTSSRQVVFGYRREEHAGKVNVVPTEYWPPEGYQPPLTVEQFYAKFPYRDPEPVPNPDAVDPLVLA
jgi:hypothetical protein